MAETEAVTIHLISKKDFENQPDRRSTVGDKEPERRTDKGATPKPTPKGPTDGTDDDEADKHEPKSPLTHPPGYQPVPAEDDSGTSKSRAKTKEADGKPKGDGKPTKGETKGKPDAKEQEKKEQAEHELHEDHWDCPICFTENSIKKDPLCTFCGLQSLVPGNTLFPDKRLYVGASLVSTSKKYKLTIEDTGNFVIRKSGDDVWASATQPAKKKKTKRTNTEKKRGGGYTLANEGANLTLFDDDDPMWTAIKDGKEGGKDLRLVMEDNGSAVLYSGEETVWSSHDSGTTDVPKKPEDTTIDDKEKEKKEPT